MADFEVTVPKNFDRALRLTNALASRVFFNAVRDQFLAELGRKVKAEIQANLENPGGLGFEPLSDKWVEEKARRGWDSRMFHALGELASSVRVYQKDGQLRVGWGDTRHSRTGTPLYLIAQALEFGVADLGIPDRPLVRKSIQKVMRESYPLLKKTFLDSLSAIVR